MAQQGHIFEVEMPDGSILEIDAPKNTLPAQIKARAAQFWATKPKGGNVAAEQRRKFPTVNFSGVDPDRDRTASEVFIDQAQAAGDAVKSLPGSLVDAAREGGTALLEMLTGKGSQRASNMVSGAVQGVARPAATLATQGAELYGGMPNALMAMTGVEAPSPEDPRTAEMAGAAGQNLAMTLGVPAVTQGVPAATRAVLSKFPKGKLSDSFKPDPVSTYVRAVKPAKNQPDFATKSAPDALDELKAYEDMTGKPVITVEQAREGLQARSRFYNQEVAKILEPRADIAVRGSGARLAQAKIDAIPDAVRLMEPEKYQSLVQAARRTAGKDFTIGEINRIRQGSNAKASPTYKKGLSGQIIVDENLAAMDLAAANEARSLLYDAVNETSPLAGSAFREANRRIGRIIENQELIEGKINRSIAQNQSRSAKAAEALGKVLSPGQTLKDFSKGTSATISEDLASAIRRWDRRPAPIPQYGSGPISRGAPSQFSMPSGVAPGRIGSAREAQPPIDQLSSPSGVAPRNMQPAREADPPVDYLRGR